MTRIGSGYRSTPAVKVKVPDNIYTVLLVIAFVFVVAAIVFNELDLTERYGVEWTKTLWPFGGK